ncbi:MAG: ABC transporter permease [Microbacteriaceae bacterium]|nr:ABC transporter permease [Microbacteriaceae bacterium]
MLLVGLLLLFVLPALKSGPRELPICVVGADAAQAIVELEAASPGAYVVEVVPSVAALDAAIVDRALVGGLVLADGRVEARIATSGSSAVAAALADSGAALAGALGLEAAVHDVVPLPAADPAGVGVGGLAFPLVFGGIVPVVAFRAVLGGRPGWMLAGLVGFSLVGGAVIAAVLRFAFGSIERGFWPVAGALALGIAALALPLAGLQARFGAKGFTIGAMVMMFLGNPFAGIATGAAWLPAGVALLGQLLPPGAAGTLVRAVAYFDGAGGGAAAVTLAVWAGAGAVLWALGRRSAERARVGGAQ